MTNKFNIKQNAIADTATELETARQAMPVDATSTAKEALPLAPGDFAVQALTLGLGHTAESIPAPIVAIEKAVANLADQQKKLRETLKSNMASLNAMIEQKSAELNKLIMSVSIDDATKLLMNQLRDDIEHHQASRIIRSNILAARKVTNFGAVETMGGFDGSGNLTFSKSITSPIHLVEYDSGVFTLLALCPDLFYPAIEANIRHILKDAGVPENSPGTDELLNQARALSAEIQALEAQRREFRDQFAMTAPEDMPNGYQEFLRRTNGGTFSPRTEPSVTRADGRQMEFGHSRLESLQLAEDQVDKINREAEKENAY